MQRVRVTWCVLLSEGHLVDQATAPQWDPSMQMAVEEKTISMSYAKLLLYKETIERAREAAKSSMASLCENLTKLKNEITIFNNR